MTHKWRGGKKHEAKGDSNKESTIICYECKKPDHIKAECPLLKKQKEKKEKQKRAMATITWSDDEEFNSEEEPEHKEMANLYLMEHEKGNELSTSNSSQFTFNELQDTFDVLMAEFKSRS